MLDDLEMQDAHLTNYCPAIDHYLRKHPEHHGLIDSRQPGMSDRQALMRIGTPETRLEAALRAEHARLRDLGAAPQNHQVASHHRRHGADLFTAHAAQHLPASAEVLLRQAKSWPPEEVSRYLGNLKAARAVAARPQRPPVRRQATRQQNYMDDSVQYNFSDRYSKVLLWRVDER